MPALPFDPTTLPIDAVSSDPALAGSILTPERLRHSFLQPQPWEPEVIAEARLRARGEPVPAAVLIPIVVHPEGAAVLLTQRTAHLHDHAGQISFPGGRAERHDQSPIETALRETEEEIGLARDRVEVIGSLPEYFTGTGYRITPVVGLTVPPLSLAPDSFEVAEVFEVPLSFLMDPQHHQTRRAVLPEGDRLFYAMPFERHFIWGATAGMLRNLYRFLAAQLGPLQTA